jgi:Trypsin-like peptidase domain
VHPDNEPGRRWCRLHRKTFRVLTTTTVVVVLAFAVPTITSKFQPPKHSPSPSTDRDSALKPLSRAASTGTGPVDNRGSIRSRQSKQSGNETHDPASLSLHSRVGIQAFGCGMIPRAGAGVTVGNRLVLTDAHVVAGSSSLQLLINGTMTSGKLVHLDANLDLALIQVNTNISWGVGQNVPLGRAVKGDQGWVALERNERLVPTQVQVLRPVTITTEDIYVKGRVTRSGYEIQASTRPGDSGAAVIVDRKIVGLLWSRSQLSDHRAWLTDTSSAAKLLDAPNLWHIPADTRCH